jgi:hypothetical protein
VSLHNFLFICKLEKQEFSMEFDSATIKNEILSFAEKWMEMEIILSEISQVLKPNTACFLSDVEYRPNKYTKSAMKNNSI